MGTAGWEALFLPSRFSKITRKDLTNPASQSTLVKEYIWPLCMNSFWSFLYLSIAACNNSYLAAGTHSCIAML